MKLKIKEEYKGSILSPSKLGGKQVRVADMKEEEYLFYYKNGLDFIFEEQTPLKIAIENAKNYAKEEFKPKKRGKNVSNNK